ncbi:MAG TPA: hypothetical protein VMG39_16325 [Pseudolabrys sp.]|nr:hypothetical protein [Pseudolabrys sp.]
MKVIIFVLGLAHVLILFASAIALTLFILKRLARRVAAMFAAKPPARKPAAPREKLYVGPLTGPATVRLPRHLRN